MKELVNINFCRTCKKECYHNTLFSLETFEGTSEKSQEEEYYGKQYHNVKECRKCKSISFEILSIDVHEDFPDYPLEPEVTKTIYPPILMYHNSLLIEGSRDNIPETIQDFYYGSLDAFSHNSYSLVALCFKGIINEVCLDLKIESNNFSEIIKSLTKVENLSKIDIQVLETLLTKTEDFIESTIKEINLYLALEIIERMINQLYLSPQRITYT
ncbi:MAG: hypothetical protein EOP00_21485 [Pedobacter sp.]|nr:MAG: hypothetical protein EOP00_21485 [Pedobacter sp.]